MTIITTQSRITYAGDNISTVFQIPFEFFLATDITAIKTAVGGAQSTLVQGVDYTLAGAGVVGGGSATKTTALLTGETLALFLNPPITQASHYISNSPFPSGTLENDIDRQAQISQRLQDQISRSIRAPDGDANPGMTLAPAAQRALQYAAFDSNGNVVSTAALPGTANTPASLGLALYPRTGAESAAAITPTSYWYPPGNVCRYGALPGTDSTAAFQAAVNQYAQGGAPVYAPAGTYIISSAVTLSTTGLFVPALRLTGDGQTLTIIDNRVASGSCFLSKGGTAGSQQQLGGYVRDLQIITTTSPASSNGIEIQAVYNFEVRNCWIKGLSGDAVRITCTVGDADACNQVLLQNCRLENCATGLNSNFNAGITQPSFIECVKCFFQGHTTAGWRYAGGNGRMDNCAFAAMACPGLWIYYNTANNPQFTSSATTFENCGNSTNPSIQIDALLSGNFTETEIANTVVIGGSSPQIGVLIGSASGAGSYVKFDSSYIRIGSGFTPFTAFQLGANANECRIINTMWQNYDAAGQVRYLDSGTANVVSDGFAQQVLGTIGGTSLIFVNGANENYALPLDGSVFVVSGPTGAFNIGGFAKGWPGRELKLINLSGFAMTLTGEDVTSAAANRLRADNGGSPVINTSGAAQFMYINARWQLMGHG